MPNGLSNKRILVTRPTGQASRLQQMIIEQGGDPVIFPVIEISPYKNDHKLLKLFNQINRFDYLLFISRNAVACAFANYLEQSSIAKNTKIFAIGAGTAEALKDFNLETKNHASAQADSETQLTINAFSDKQVQGKKILIVRGQGGRELLSETLLERGAEVSYAEVYQRLLPEYETNYITNLWQNVKPEIIIITSKDGLDNLLKLTPDEFHAPLFQIDLVLMSSRLIEYAKSIGFKARLVTVKETSNAGLLAALLALSGD